MWAARSRSRPELLLRPGIVGTVSIKGAAPGLGLIFMVMSTIAVDPPLPLVDSGDEWFEEA